MIQEPFFGAGKQSRVMRSKNVNLLYLMEVFSGFARGSYLVCIGWTALVISNDVAVVGQVFIAQNLTVVLAGPVVGVMIDRHKRKQMIIQAQLLIAVAMSGMGLLLFQTIEISAYWIFGIVIAISTARLTYRGAFEGIIREAVDDKDVLQTIARANTAHLLATAAGMAGIGFVIDRFSSGHGFIMSALASVFLLVVGIFLNDGMVKLNSRGLPGYWSDFKIGLEIFQCNVQIRLLTLLMAVALPVGHLANAILSSFIRDDLGQSSYMFGIIDAGWAFGGMLAASVLSTKIKMHQHKYSEYFLAMLAGAATVVFSYCSDIISLTLVHGFMGFFVWSCRIIIGGRVIELCENENVGRTRVYMESIFSLSATLMCLSPTAIMLEATASYFLYWGLFIVVSSMILLSWRARQSG